MKPNNHDYIVIEEHWKLIFKFSCRYIKTDGAVLDKFDGNGVSVFSFKKDAFASRVFTL